MYVLLKPGVQKVGISNITLHGHNHRTNKQDTGRQLWSGYDWPILVEVQCAVEDKEACCQSEFRYTRLALTQQSRASTSLASCV